jgi:hypothetical protein
MTSARHALSSKITTEGRNRINTNARRLPSPRMDGHKFLGGRYFHDLGEVAVVSRGCSGGRPRASTRRGYVVAHLPKVATGRADGAAVRGGFMENVDAGRVRPANAITDSDAGRVPGERCLPQCRPRRLSNTGSPSGSVPPLRGLRSAPTSRDDRPDAVSSPAIFGSNRSRMRKDVRRPGGHNDRPPPRRRAARWGSSPS